MHVFLESPQAEQKGAAVEGLDGRVVGLNAGPVDAAVVGWFHRRVVSAMLSIQTVGATGRGRDSACGEARQRRHSSGRAKVTIMLLPIGASSSEA